MKITNEADYALRIMHFLACNTSSDKNIPDDSETADAKSAEIKIADAKKIADAVSVPAGFTLKILRKLVCGGLVVSYKGAKGGYAIGAKPSDVTMRTIVELIDGPFTISRCLCDGHECKHSAGAECGCYFHRVFDEINLDISKKLESITLEMVMHNSYKL